MVNVILDELTEEQKLCVGLALDGFRDSHRVFWGNLRLGMVMPCVLRVALCRGVEPPFIRQVSEYLMVGNQLTTDNGHILWPRSPLPGLPW